MDADLLPVTRPVYRGFLFIKAVALAETQSRLSHAITEKEVAALAEPLLRALIIDPRQRDLLGSLGGLYLWFRRDQRARALDWLEAAETMGVSGRIVRRILERDRLVEMNRTEALDWFRSASSRFLRDPGVAGEVRGALIEELGRFQEFEPLLIDLRDRPEIAAAEPTVKEIRERCQYLAELMANVSLRGEADLHARLAQIEAAYRQSLAALEQNAKQIGALEKQIFSEMSHVLTI